MKKIIFLFIASLSSFVLADTIHMQDLSGGMNSYISPSKIPDNSAAYIQNFYSDIQPMAVERNGYVLQDSNIGSLSKPVLGMWRFQDNTGQEWLIEYSSRTYYKHTLSGSATIFGPTATTSNLPRAATNLGKIMFVNGVDAAWTFDGTSTATVAGAPVGTLIAPWRTRFVISGISGAQSTVRFSADGDATSWTLGGLSTDPFSIQVGGANDGYAVKCMGNYQDNLVIQRKYDTWFVSGFDQSDVQNRNVSSEVGCLEPGSAREFDGSYMFLSARGIEEMQGGTIKLASEPIRNFTDQIVKNTANTRSNIQTLISDWGVGSSSDTVYIDTITSPGDVQLTFPDTFSTLRDGTNGTKDVWTRQQVGNPGNITSTNGELSMVAHFPPYRILPLISNRLNDYSGGTTYYIEITSMSAALSSHVDIEISTSNYAFDFLSEVDYIYFTFKSTISATGYLSSVTSRYFDGAINTIYSGPSATFSIPAAVSIFMSTTNYIVNVNGQVLLSSTHTLTNMPVYYKVGFTNPDVLTTKTATFDNFGISPETATFTTQIIPTGSLITSWGPSTISDVKTGTATITYQVGSTSTANTGVITNWASITSPAIPSVTTNTYVAYRASFRQTTPTETAKLSEISTTWNEGGIAIPSSYNYDRRYWLAVTTNTDTNPVIDTVLVYQRNRTWTMLKGMNIGSLSIWRDNLYFGESTNTGNVYKFDVGNNDNGSNINSLITFKSYDIGTPTQDKDFRLSHLIFLGNYGYSGTFTTGYYVDQGTNSYTLGTSNMNDGTGQVLEKMNFKLDGTMPLQGREIQYTLNKNGTGDRLKLFDIFTNYTIKEER